MKRGITKNKLVVASEYSERSNPIKFNKIATSHSVNASRNSRIGFTLAEVLITLGVIGVVAAMTLPKLVQNYQKYKTVNQLKKSYTILNQAFKMSEIDNDTYENWTLIGDEFTTKEFAEKYFKPYLKVIKTCNNPISCYNGTNPLRASAFGLVLNDGSYVWFRTKNSVPLVTVDINGIVRPNIYGRDMFFFDLGNKGIYTKFVDGTYCNEIDRDGCVGKIIHDGWKISDDYPW